MTTYYIDPSAPTNGDGSLATPFNTWNSVTWAASNTYLQRGGTTYTDQITVGSNNVYVGSYQQSVSDPILAYVVISTSSVEGIRTSTRSNVIIENFFVLCTVNNPSGASIGIHVRQACSDTIVRNCVAAGFYYGFLSDNFNLLSSSQVRTTYKNCIAFNNWGTGFHCTNACNNILWDSCEAFGNGFTTNTTGGHGFSGIAERQNTFSWTLVSGNVYKATITLTNPLLRITNFTDGPASLTLNAGAGPGATLTNNQYDTDATFVYVNIGKNPSTVSMQAFSNDLYNLTWLNCKSYRNIEGYPSEGHGWMIDEGTINSKLISCVAFENGYDGFQTARTLNVQFYGCLSFKNKQTGFRSNSAANGTSFYNCTSANNLVGYQIGTLAESILLKNSICYKNLTQGMILRSTSTADYVNSFGNGSADSGGTVTNLTTTDPLLNEFYQPTSSSPVIGTGTYLGVYQDNNGTTFQNPPSIGAFEYVRTRTTASTRSPRN